jgi:hypothetical protein
LSFCAAESALYDVVALLDAPTAAKAEPLAAEFLEYLDAMDYNKYFDAMPTRTVSLLACLQDYACGVCLLSVCSRSPATWQQ